MHLYFLGTASGLPVASRFSQTTVLRVEGDLHLLDVADGASALMLRASLDHRAVRSVTISHMHADHHSGLLQLLKTMMHINRRSPLVIYLPEEGIQAYQAMLTASYLLPEWLGFDCRWLAIEAERQVELGPQVSLVAHENNHLQPLRERAARLAGSQLLWGYESYSFVVNVAGAQLLYTGNLHRSLAEVLPFAEGVDVLVSELAHLRPEQCLPVLRQLSPRVAIFSHFHPRWDEANLKQLAAGVPGVTVHISRDGDALDLTAMLEPQAGVAGA